jgi:hypothetical protein
MYFAASAIIDLERRAAGSRNPGFSAAWFKSDSYVEATAYDVEGFAVLSPLAKPTYSGGFSDSLRPAYTSESFIDASRALTGAKPCSSPSSV